MIIELHGRWIGIKSIISYLLECFDFFLRLRLRGFDGVVFIFDESFILVFLVFECVVLCSSSDCHVASSSIPCTVSFSNTLFVVSFVTTGAFFSL